MPTPYPARTKQFQLAILTLKTKIRFYDGADTGFLCQRHSFRVYNSIVAIRAKVRLSLTKYPRYVSESGNCVCIRLSNRDRCDRT